MEVGRGHDTVHREDVGGASHFLLITYFSLFSGQFLEELSKFSSLFYKLRAKERESSSKGKRGLLREQNLRGKEGAGESGWRDVSSWGVGAGGTPICCLICPSYESHYQESHSNCLLSHSSIHSLQQLPWASPLRLGDSSRSFFSLV